MEWKPYINYKDIEACGLSRKTAYKILRDLAQTPVKENGHEVPWCDTYEASQLGGMKIPTDIFLSYFPACRKFFIKRKEA